MSYKPTITSPPYRPWVNGNRGGLHACIVVAVNGDGTVNLIVFDCLGEVQFVKNAVVVQEDADGCPVHFSDPEHLPQEQEHPSIP